MSAFWCYIGSWNVQTDDRSISRHMQQLVAPRGPYLSGRAYAWCIEGPGYKSTFHLPRVGPGSLDCLEGTNSLGRQCWQSWTKVSFGISVSYGHFCIARCTQTALKVAKDYQSVMHLLGMVKSHFRIEGGNVVAVDFPITVLCFPFVEGTFQVSGAYS